LTAALAEPYVEPVVLARAPAAGGGELVLRVRPRAQAGGRDTYELIVDGVFAMDTVQVSSELRLASETLARLDPPPQPGWRVLVGGLGFGYTLRELLADKRVGPVDVVELEPALVDWVRDGLVAPALGLLEDVRTTVIVADLVTHLSTLPPAWYDAILLDIDNGPDFLVHQSNSTLYAEPALRQAVAALRPGGRLAIWSAAASPALAERLRIVAAEVEVVTLPIHREGRTFDYVLYLASA
jgi:spermidine synthase